MPAAVAEEKTLNQQAVKVAAKAAKVAAVMVINKVLVMHNQERLIEAVAVEVATNNLQVQD
jgi:hypothetical protein